MQMLSQKMKLLFAFVLVLIMAGALYIYWSNRQFKATVGVDRSSSEVATSSQVVISRVSKTIPILGRDVTIVDTRLFDVVGVTNSNHLYILVFMTGSASTTLAENYKSYLSTHGYQSYREVIKEDRTDISAQNATSTVTVDIKPMNGQLAVTLLVGQN